MSNNKNNKNKIKTNPLANNKSMGDMVDKMVGSNIDNNTIVIKNEEIETKNNEIVANVQENDIKTTENTEKVIEDVLVPASEDKKEEPNIEENIEKENIEEIKTEEKVVDNMESIKEEVLVDTTKETSAPVKVLTMKVTAVDRAKLIPAPLDWNFYLPLPEEKMKELVDSVREKGILHPLVVWERPGNKYMILSGHNRNKAYEKLYDTYQLTDVNRAEQYKTIPAHIFKKNELTDEDAQQIIIDTNWVQRELTAMEKQKSIFRKYTSLGRKQRSANGEQAVENTRDIIAREYSISGRQVSKYIKLNYLIPQFQTMIDNKTISIAAGAKLADFEDNIQSWIYKEFREKLNNKTIMSLGGDMTPSQILAIFNPPIVELSTEEMYITETLLIPVEFKESYFKTIVKFFKDHKLDNVPDQYLPASEDKA